MASLFDLATGLSASQETALGILDDALRHIYGASASASASAVAVAAAAAPVDPLEPPECCADADRAARDALRALGEEVERLRTLGSRADADADADQAVAQLARVFIDERLEALPGSPFVLLARKKARLKLEQLRLALQPPRLPGKEAEQSPAPSTGDWRCRVEVLKALPADKQAVLRRLAALPERERRRLPAAQRELAGFVARLDALLALPEAQRRQLPAEHQRALEALLLWRREQQQQQQQQP